VNLPARGRAAGKIILLGEHAVVYGRPALAAGLGVGLVAEVGPADGPARIESDRPELAGDARPQRLVEEAAALVGLVPRGFVVRVRSALPPGAGLGSSAALCVAVLRALAVVAGRQLPPDEELALGRRLEAIFHGYPSGVDPAAAALGTCFRFVRGEPATITPLVPACPLSLVVVLGDRPRSTGSAVGGLRARWEMDRERHERLFDAVAATVDAGERALRAGDLGGLGAALDRNHELLCALGVSAPEVDAMVLRARAVGARGAKLTGGGAGGAVLALADDPERTAAALAAGGGRTMIVRVGAIEEAAA
jgi:mevalonate kinase